jgi:hypothetical protein
MTLHNLGIWTMVYEVGEDFGRLWICKEKKRLYRQVNFAAPGETDDGIPMVKLAKYGPPNRYGTYDGFWVRRDSLTPVTYEMIERAFLDLKITF